MELINRVKFILLNPKEEWDVIEAENPPHEKVLPYLLILALIPAVALFFSNWWQWYSAITESIQRITDTAAQTGNATRLEEAVKLIKESNPFNPITGIVEALTVFIITLGSAYLTAIVINVLSNHFDVTKDFNRSFSLVAYSYTPLCIAGILYAYPPLKSLTPYIGLYGIYLLYVGVKPRINPAAQKVTGYFIMSVIVALAVYIIVPKIVKPISNDIHKNILIEQAKEKAKKNNISLYDSKFRFTKIANSNQQHQ